MSLLLETVALFIFAVASTSIAARLWATCNRVLTFAGIAALIGCGWATLHLLTGAAWESMLPSLLLYACLSELMILITITSLTSISVRILCRMSHQPLDSADITDGYSSDDIVDIRLTRLLEAGYMAAQGDQLVLTRRGSLVARLFTAFQYIFGHAANDAWQMTGTD
jgi:hypothetical protein